MEKYSVEYNDLLAKSREKLAKIDIGNYPNNEILIPIQRELNCNYNEAETSSTSDNKSVIIFRYVRKRLFGGWVWDLVGNNITNNAPTYL